jgi:hypothetical protein
MSASPQLVEPQTLESNDTEFISIVQDELDELSTNFHHTLEAIDKLIELESIDFEKEEAKFVETAEEYSEISDHKKASLSLLKISKLENDFEEIYVDQLNELENLTHNSFEAYRKNFEALYEEDIKSSELRQLEKSKAKILPIKIDDKVELEGDVDFSKGLDVAKEKETDNKEEKKEDVNTEDIKASEDVEMVNVGQQDAARKAQDSHNITLFNRKDYNDLTEEEIHRLLRMEKIKRARISYKNEAVFKPEISKLKREFEKWVSYDDELKRFLNKDITEMYKKVQAIKKKEKV